jgi:predicted membrane protein
MAAGLWGLLGVVLVVPVAALLAVSVVGIVLIPFEMLGVALAVLVGYVALAIVVGRKAAEAFKKPDISVVLAALAGLLLLWIASWVPIVGWIVKVLAAVVGLGGVIVLLHKLGTEKRTPRRAVEDQGATQVQPSPAEPGSGVAK